MRLPCVIFLFSFFLLAHPESRAQAVSPDCRSFRAGDFLFTDTAGITWELKRAKHRQTEKNKSNGMVIKFKITWLSDCEYRLTQTWSNDRRRRKWNRTSRSYRIISTANSSYSYDCACQDGTTVSGTVVKAMN